MIIGGHTMGVISTKSVHDFFRLQVVCHRGDLCLCSRSTELRDLLKSARFKSSWTRYVSPSTPPNVTHALIGGGPPVPQYTKQISCRRRKNGSDLGLRPSSLFRLRSVAIAAESILHGDIQALAWSMEHFADLPVQYSTPTTIMPAAIKQSSAGVMKG
jgi:hypothetical protein